MAKADQDDSGFWHASFTNLSEDEMFEVRDRGGYTSFVVVVARREVGNVEPTGANSALTISDWSTGPG